MFRRSIELLKAGLAKTRNLFSSGIKGLFRIGRRIDRDFLAELEEQLLMADVGVVTTAEVVRSLEEAYREREIAEQDPEVYLEFIKSRIKATLTQRGNEISMAPGPPTVILVVGVNGSGKTTSIAKLAHHFHNVEGKRVLLAASDTFRAAAVEQLEIWSKRIGCDIVKHKTGADPSAVAFDAASAAVARGVEVLIVDTAGRLHTQTNLMNELKKIKRVLGKKIEGAPHECLLVLDATTGQNAINQAKLFDRVAEVSGLFLAKLDGTAKGGVVIAISKEVEIPVKFVGLGEKVEHIQKFEAGPFVDALFA